LGYIGAENLQDSTLKSLAGHGLPRSGTTLFDVVCSFLKKEPKTLALRGFKLWEKKSIELIGLYWR
jgi:hypothetical protein